MISADSVRSVRSPNRATAAAPPPMQTAECGEPLRPAACACRRIARRARVAAQVRGYNAYNTQQTMRIMRRRATNTKHISQRCATYNVQPETCCHDAVSSVAMRRISTTVFQQHATMGAVRRSCVRELWYLSTSARTWRAQACRCTHTRAHTHPPTRTRAHSNPPTRIHARARARARKCTSTLARTHARTHASVCAQRAD